MDLRVVHDPVHGPHVNRALFWNDVAGPLFGHVVTGGKQTGGNEICVVSGMTVQCRRDTRCRHCTGKRLSRTIWSSFNKERMSHLCDSMVAGPTAQRDNAPASRREYPPFRYPLLLKCARTVELLRLFKHKTFRPHYQNLPFWTPSKSLCISFLGTHVKE